MNPADRPERGVGGWRALVAVGRRSELSVTAAMVAMLSVVTFGAVAAPRLLREAEADGLAQAIEQAPASHRRLSIRLIDDFARGFDDDPLGEQRARLDEVAADIEPSLLDLYGPPRLVVDSSRFVVVATDVVDASPDAPEPTPEPPPPALPTFLTFRVHPELDDHSRLVAGRPAGPTDRRVGDREVFEFELTPEAAEELEWDLGEVVHLTNDATDLVTRQFSGGLPADFAAELVGLRELDPPEDLYWSGDPRAHRPAIADTGTGANVFAFGMVAVGQMPSRPFVVGGRSPFSIEHRRDLIDGAIDLDTVGSALEGLTALDVSFASQPTLSRPGVTSGLRPALETERDQRRAARATLALAAAGVLGVVVATLAQLLIATFARRRDWLTVARARGANTQQMIGAAAFEMAVVSLAAMVVGVVPALFVVGGERTTTELTLLAGVLVGAVAAGAAAAWAESARPVTVSARASAHPGLGRWGRVGGGMLVVVAAAALVTFRRRGVAVESPDVDLLLVLLPVLVPLAIVFLTRWVLPVVLGQLARRGMALGPGRLVGLRRVISAPASSTGVMTVLVLSLTVASLGLGVNRSLGVGAVDASWLAVGAPYRIDTRDVEVAGAVRALPGAVVSAAGGSRINLDHADGTYNVQFTAIDVPALRELTAATAADDGYPDALDATDPAGRVPIIASERMGGQRIRVGDVLAGVGSRAGQEFVVVEVRTEAFGRRNSWTIVDRTVYASVAGFEPGFNTLAIGVPDDQRAALAAIATGADEELEVRTDILDQQRADPLGRAVRAGYLLAGLLAVTLALVAVVAVSVVTARERRNDVAVLGLLGSGRREIVRAVASELVPAAVAGVAAGSLVGWLVVRLYDGRFDLSSFAGGSPVSIGPDAVGGLLVGAALAVAVVVVIAGLVRRIVHAPVGDVLRIDGGA